ncbi:hypothetical protein [Paenibacillus sp. 276b]|uniref:hypothetical protein n=1 Tax=Paenibacillus sp. 276b TaxID=1566277 RepID=UPI00089B6E34|nr:hypothetical protein [Paenibacillus sp. 276b]SEB27509.1 hypothetical protein SAMN03159332_6170 [Paenibacillus sp. 276b]
MVKKNKRNRNSKKNPNKGKRQKKVQQIKISSMNLGQILLKGKETLKKLANFIRSFDKSFIGRIIKFITLILTIFVSLGLLSIVISNLINWNWWFPFNLERAANLLDIIIIHFSNFMQIDKVPNLALMISFWNFLFNAVKSLDMKILAINKMDKIPVKSKIKLVITDLYVAYTLIGLSHFLSPEYVNSFRSMGISFIFTTAIIQVFLFLNSKKNKQNL